MNDPMRIPDQRSLPAEWVQRYAAHFVSEIALQRSLQRRRRRRLVLVLIPAVVVLLAVTAFTTYALTREPTHFESIGCFETTSLNANTAIVNADGRDPVVICTELWEREALGGQAGPRRLVACVLQSGAVGVFPSAGADTCAGLGLAALPASYAAERKRFAALRNAIVSQLGEPASGSSRGSPKCVDEEAAKAHVRRELNARGYSEWQIEVAGDGFTAERPCAEATFDGRRRVVVLIPVWPR